MTNFGEYITQLRLAKGWSYRQLADKAEISFATIQDIESGKTKNPGIQAVIGLAKALEVHPMKLLLAYQGKDPNEANAEEEGLYKQLVMQLVRDLPADAFEALIEARLGKDKIKAILEGLRP